jgi:hypothetical protein
VYRKSFAFSIHDYCIKKWNVVSFFNGIGGRSVIIIRYNPDAVKNKGIILNINNADRIDLLVKTIKEELIKEYNSFIVKIIQIFYNDNYDKYQNIKEENITDLVCI